MGGARKRWRASGRGIKVRAVRQKTKRLRERVRGFFRLIRSWCFRRQPLVREDGGLYYTSIRRSNSFYADAIADCIDFINRSSA